VPHRAMVVAMRVQAIHDFVEAGREVGISYAYAASTGRMRVKISVGAYDGVVAQAARPLLHAALQPLATAIDTHVVVDRGHRFSAGHAWACFWLQPHVGSPPGLRAVQPTSTTALAELMEVSAAPTSLAGARNYAVGAATEDACAKSPSKGANSASSAPPVAAAVAPLVTEKVLKNAEAPVTAKFVVGQRVWIQHEEMHALVDSATVPASGESFFYGVTLDNGTLDFFGESSLAPPSPVRAHGTDGWAAGWHRRGGRR
jgi:hypothetical protein